MKILVTGGAGFIGSHVAEALLQKGHEVHILDNLSGGFRKNIPAKAVFHEMDIQNKAVHELWADHNFEVMFHLAAQMDVRKSVADPIYDANINIIGLLNLLEAGRKNGLRKVIFSSTGGAIYGEPITSPQDENHPNIPMSPYGITKMVSEHYLRFYGELHGLQWIALRYGNVYGPRQNAHGEAGVVAIFTEKMLRNEPCFINGDGLQTRDYVHVSDVVQANVLALDYNKNDIFNVGTGIETNVVELFRHIKTFTESPAPEDHAPAKAGEQMRSVLCNQKLQNVLGWKQTYSVEKGLENTVNWFKGELSK